MVLEYLKSLIDSARVLIIVILFSLAIAEFFNMISFYKQMQLIKIEMEEEIRRAELNNSQK